MSELHCRNLVQLNPDQGNHLRSPYVFRGMDVAKWELETSLQRLSKDPGKTKLIETSLIRSFRKYANAGAFDDKTEWYVLAVAQHNGLPTRVLDWTASPLVAAHFACGDKQYKNDDGAIWCLHAGTLREINEQNNRGAGSYVGFPGFMILDCLKEASPTCRRWIRVIPAARCYCSGSRHP